MGEPGWFPHGLRWFPHGLPGRRIVHPPPRNHGRDDLRVEVVPGVAVEHDEVGGVAGQELSARALVAREPGRSERRCREGLVDRHRLLRVPGGSRVDRAPHPGADPGERVELFDGRVGAVGDDGSGVDQRAVCVGAAGLAGPEPVGQVAIRGRVGELHRRRDAELGEAGEILGARS